MKGTISLFVLVAVTLLKSSYSLPVNTQDGQSKGIKNSPVVENSGSKDLSDRSIKREVNEMDSKESSRSDLSEKSKSIGPIHNNARRIIVDSEKSRSDASNNSEENGNSRNSKFIRNASKVDDNQSKTRENLDDLADLLPKGNMWEKKRKQNVISYTENQLRKASNIQPFSIRQSTVTDENSNGKKCKRRKATSRKFEENTKKIYHNNFRKLVEDSSYRTIIHDTDSSDENESYRKNIAKNSQRKYSLNCIKNSRSQEKINYSPRFSTIVNDEEKPDDIIKTKELAGKELRFNPKSQQIIYQSSDFTNDNRETFIDKMKQAKLELNLSKYNYKNTYAPVKTFNQMPDLTDCVPLGSKYDNHQQIVNNNMRPWIVTIKVLKNIQPKNYLKSTPRSNELYSPDACSDDTSLKENNSFDEDKRITMTNMYNEIQKSNVNFMQPKLVDENQNVNYLQNHISNRLSISSDNQLIENSCEDESENQQNFNEDYDLLVRSKYGDLESMSYQKNFEASLESSSGESYDNDWINSDKYLLPSRKFDSKVSNHLHDNSCEDESENQQNFDEDDNLQFYSKYGDSMSYRKENEKPPEYYSGESNDNYLIRSDKNLSPSRKHNLKVSNQLQSFPVEEGHNKVHSKAHIILENKPPNDYIAASLYKNYNTQSNDIENDISTSYDDCDDDQNDYSPDNFHRQTISISTIADASNTYNQNYNNEMIDPRRFTNQKVDSSEVTCEEDDEVNSNQFS